jgi:hypothetical protein
VPRSRPYAFGILYTLGLETGYSSLAWWLSVAVTLVGAALMLGLLTKRLRD